MESIKNIAGRHKMSEGAIKQNLLRNKRKEKKRKKMLDNPEFDYHGILYPSLKK